jgi:antitoxin (DNA-binding transcriptional repressor) of toxin-antitoxin stability system
MRAVGLKILKNRLAEFIRLAAGGETILVTDRSRVVAEIVPPQPGRAMYADDAVLANAVRDGTLTPPLYPQGGVPPSQPVAPLRELLEELERDRDRK